MFCFIIYTTCALRNWNNNTNTKCIRNILKFQHKLKQLGKQLWPRCITLHLSVLNEMKETYEWNKTSELIISLTRIYTLKPHLGNLFSFQSKEEEENS